MHPMLTHRASETNPLRSLPLLSHPARIFGWRPLDKACVLLEQAEREVEVRWFDLAAVNAVLGRANRITTAGFRRMEQAKAMRGINAARRWLRDAHRQLAAARAEVVRLENQPELPFPPPVVRQPASATNVLRQPRGTFPAGTTTKLERGTHTGWGATITRPDGSGIATHMPSMDEAARWLDDTLSAPTLH